MENINKILENSLLAQLAMEEELFKNVEKHLSQSNLQNYPEAKQILTGIKTVLEEHYETLNSILDVIYQRRKDQAKKNLVSSLEPELNNTNGASIHSQLDNVSKILQDDYISLNQAIVGNSLIHTTALAANSDEIANTALTHVKNLASYIFKINELVPSILALELSAQFPELKDKSKALSATVAKNIREAWRIHDEEVKENKESK